MASLCHDPNGARRILVMVGGKRKTIRLGGIPKRQAEGILREIEALSSAKIDGSAPPEKTAKWLAGIDDKLRERLVRAGLVAPLGTAAPVLTLSAAIEQFNEAKRWRNEGTKELYGHAFARLLRHFGADMPIEEISEGHAEDFRSWLEIPKPKGGGLAESTANKTCALASTLFRRYVKYRLIPWNPFDDVEKTSIVGEKKMVSPEDSKLVLEQLRGTQEKLLFCLARWGGLRVPSEPRLLRWGDVDWERRLLRVTCQKTAHFKGHEERMVPIFDEISDVLAERFEEAEEGEEFVLPFMQHRVDSTFSSMLSAAVKRAKLKPWPRIWHSLRATRQTELIRTSPPHVVYAIIGNSAAVAHRNYIQVSADDLAQVAQKAAQTVHATTRNESQETNDAESQSA